MKICSTCKLEKELSEFSKNKAKADGLQVVCKSCRKIYADNYYQTVPKEKERLLKKNYTHRDALKKIVIEKKSVPCADCKVSYPFYVMDFDHQFDKKFTIAIAVMQGRSIKSVLEEIAKCEVVCSNCHRIRTHKYLDDIVLKDILV